MKKFTLLMTLFLAFAGIGTMQAQQPFEVSDEPTDNQYAATTKWYTIKNRDGHYIIADGNHVDANGNLKLVAGDPTGITGYWCLTGNETDGYQLRNAAFPAGMVLGTTGDGGDGGNARCNLYYADETNSDVTTRYDVTEATNENATGTFCITLHGTGNHGFNNRNGYLSLWNAQFISTADTPSSQYTFEEVTETITPELQKLKVYYFINDSHTGYSWTNTKFVANNSTAEKPELSSFYGDVDFAETNNTTITTDNHNFTLNVSSQSAPFQFSTPENPKWYTMYTRNGTDRYVVRESNDNIAAGGSGLYPGTTPFTSNYINSYDKLGGAMWAFVQEAGGLKLYNKAGGNYITTTGPNTDATITANGTTYYVETTTSAGGNFSLRLTGNEFAYLGSHRGDNTKLGTWNNGGNTGAQNNDGSAFTIATIEDTPDALNIALALPEIQYAYDPVNIGGYDKEAAAYVKTSINGLNTVESILNKVSTLRPAIREVKEGEYYRIIFKRGMAAMMNIYAINTQGTNSVETIEASYETAYADAEGNIAATDDTNKQRTVSVKPNFTDSDLASLWQFVKVEGQDAQYYIKNVNSGLLLGTPQNGFTRLIAKDVDKSNAGKYSIVHNNNTPKEMALEGTNISGTDKFLNTYYNGSQNQGRGLTTWRNGTNDAGNVVLIKQVTEIPVSISRAGYSTLCLPFAVTIPSAVKAYTVSNVDAQSALIMDEVTDVIPANTAVILEGTEDTYNFTITTAPDFEGTNLLTGTTLERHGMPAGEYYGLGNKTEGVAFYVANSEEMPANKAFLLKSSIPAGASLQANALTFFGETTGVGSVKTDATDADNTYYDLNGRRVAYPSRGIYVKGNGQKVFIK